MIYKLTSFLAATIAFDLNEVTDDMTQDSHKIWDSYMEKEEEVYDWFEIENSTIKSINGGTIHYLNVTSQQWLDESKAYGPNGDIWTHAVAVNIPKNLKHTNISVALVANGCNDDFKLPTAHDTTILFADELAHMAEMISIVVYQVPNCHIIYPSDPS